MMSPFTNLKSNSHQPAAFGDIGGRLFVPGGLASGAEREVFGEGVCAGHVRALPEREVVDEVGDDARQQVREIERIMQDGGDEPHGVEGIADEAAHGNGYRCAVGAQTGADRDGHGKGKDWHEAKRLRVVLHEDARAVSCRPQLGQSVSLVGHFRLSSGGNFCTAIDAEPPP